jgi:hypothetical protein
VDVPEEPINGDQGVEGTGTAGTERCPGGCPDRRHPGGPKPHRLAPPYPMLENIIEDMTRFSQEFRLPTGMIVRV